MAIGQLFASSILEIVMKKWSPIIILIFVLFAPAEGAKKKGVNYGDCGKIKGAFRGKFWHWYARAESFADCDFWDEAAEDFEGALKKRDTDQRGARTYGMRYMNYHPHRELGVCYFKLGRFEEAKRELELSLTQVETDKAHYYLERTRKALATTGEDQSAPAITFDLKGQNEVTNLRIVNLRMQIVDDNFVDAVKVNGKTIDMVGDQTVTIEHRVVLAPGENTIRVEARDLRGNVGSGDLKITLDREGPAVSVDRPSGLEPVSDAEVEVAGVVTDDSDIKSLKFGEQEITVGPDGSFSTRISLQEGENEISFAAYDVVGNESVGRIYVTQGAPSPTTPPSAGDGPSPIPGPSPEPPPVEITPPELIASIDAKPAEGHAPLTVNFTAEASGSGELSYTWDFGDGATSSEVNPNHTYDRFGEYISRLTVTDAIDRVIVKERVIKAEALQPVVTGLADAPKGTVPLTVAFTSDVGPSGPNLGRISYLWDFGDGTTADIANPVHTFELDGTYTVGLKVTGPGGESSAALQIQALAPGLPDGTLSASPDKGTLPLTTGFSFTASETSGPIESLSWDFGDGNSSTEESPRNTYSKAGAYTVHLTLTGPGGQNKITHLVQINERKPSGMLAANPGSGFTPLVVDFGFKPDTDSGPITSYSWDLGDGTTSKAQNPSHTYNTAGAFSVTLTLDGPGGSTQITEENLISASQPGELVAGFQAKPAEGLAPLSVTFLDESRGEGTLTYRWDFGDGNSSSEPNPKHTYSQFGDFKVSLKITDELNRSGEKTQHIRALANLPTVAISGDVLKGSVPLTINFGSKVGPEGPNLGDVVYLWDFGDGNTATDASPTYTFIHPGTYTVSLTVSGPGGATRRDLKVTAAPPPAPGGAIAADPSAGYGPLTTAFQFTISDDSGPIDSHSWNFGDGATSTEQNPSHTYSRPGYYTVSLTLIGPGGKTALTKADFIEVEHQPPAGSIAANRTSGTVPFSAGFSFIPDPSGGPVESYAWEFGDGSKSTEANPIHTFEKTGKFTVSVKLAGPGGEKVITKTSFIQVTQPVVVAPPSPVSGPSQVSGPKPSTGSAEDISPPQIRLNDLTEKQIVYYASMPIDGSVMDASKVKEISINGKKLKIQKAQNVFFNYPTDLAIGENTFVIEAIDSRGNTATRTIVIQREEQEINKMASRLRVAVPPFVAPKELPSKLTAGLNRAFMRSLDALGRFKIVVREGGALQNLIDEKKLSQTGLVDKGTAAKLGQMSGAEAIFVGMVTEKEKSITIDIQLIDVETGEIILSKDAFDEDKNDEQVSRLVDRLARRFKQFLPVVSGEVIMVEGDNILIDKGALHGLRKMMKVSIYREGKKIVHPRTGKILGVKNVSIGESVLMAADDEFSELSGGQVAKIQVGDKIITK